jgi:hypothetical protein
MKSLWMTPVILAGALLLGACEIPTEAPIVEQRWIIPVDETTVSVNELLPNDVIVNGSNFELSVDPFSTVENLGTLCGCAALNGLTTAAPAFSSSFTLSEGLPADVSSATISSGSVSIDIQNGFSYDVLAGGGSLTVTVTDGQGGAQVGQTMFSGNLPANSTATQTMAISSASIGSTLFVTVDISSPGGQVTTINTADQLTVTATTTSLLVSSASVNVESQSVDFDPVDLDVEDIGAEVTDRIIQGTIILDVVNPFGVSISGNVNIGATSKSFSISAAATSEVSISYTGDELKSFLGQAGVTFSGSGTASGGLITVTPAQVMTIEATLDLTIKIGG